MPTKVILIIDSKMNLLDKYVIDGNLESIKNVINGNDWKLDSKWNDYNLLKNALIYKHKEIVKFFIANNFRVNKFSIHDADTTPLHIAVELGWEDIVLLLLEKEASVEVQDSTSKLTPIQLSFIMRKYQLTDLMLPFDKGHTVHDPDTDVNHLHIACARNCITAVKNYLRLGENIDTYAESTFINSLRYTPLHFAVDFQSREAVELLLKCGASITAKDNKENTPLHLASNLYDKSLIDLLLFEHKYNGYNPTNLCKVSHFHIACTRNNLKVVYGFLQCGVDINATVETGPWEGYTALHLAVIHQCTDVVKLLLSQDNLVKDNSEIFLFDVYKTENSEIINLIMFRNRSLLAREFSGTPLKLFFRACIKGDKDEIKSLLSSDVPVNERLSLDSQLFPGATPMHILVEHDCNFISEIIDLILRRGANVTTKDARGLTPIHVVFQKYDMIQSLMNIPSRFKINVSDKEGLSLFHIVCAVGTKEVVDWFLDYVGVDVNAAVCEDSLRYPGFTPLHMAASHTHLGAFLKLLSHGGNIMIKNRQGLTPFELLFQNWSFHSDDNTGKYILCSTMTQLIQVYERHNTTFDGLEFPLLYAACLSNRQKDMVEYVVKNQIALAPGLNCALNSTRGFFAGFTPLHCAVWVHNKNMVQTLLDHGADPAAFTAEGDTPLHMAMRYLKELVLNLKTNHLLTLTDENGSSVLDVDDRLFLLQENPFGSCGFSHFHIACYLGKLEWVKAFLDRGIDPDIRIRRPLRKAPNFESEGAMWINETGLHAALRVGHREVVLLLLERGADANAPDMYQHTFLHCVLENDKNIVKLLVEDGGADVNARNSSGETPLHCACRPEGSRSVVEALLEAGADIDLMNEDGQTAINIAEDTYDVEEPSVHQLLIPVMQHAHRLLMARYPISRENKDALSLIWDYDLYNEEAFEMRCLEELERMERVRFDGRTTLRDVLRIRNVDRLRTLAGNKLFQRLVEDGLSEGGKKIALNDFPVYGYLVRLQFRRGWKRRQKMLPAVPAIGKLVERYCTRFPVECSEILLSYLTNHDLERLTQATK